MYAAAEAAVSLAEGESRRALETARRAIDEAISGGLGVAHEAVRLAFPTALEAAIDVGDLEEADRLVELLAARPRWRGPPVPPGAGHPRQGAASLAHAVTTTTWRRTSSPRRRRFATSATRTGRRGPSSTGPSGSPARERLDESASARQRSCRHLRDGRGGADARSRTSPARAGDGSRAGRRWRARCRSEPPVALRIGSLSVICALSAAQSSTRSSKPRPSHEAITRRPYEASHRLMSSNSSAGLRHERIPPHLCEPEPSSRRDLSADISLRASPARHEPRHSASSAGSIEGWTTTGREPA